MKQILSSVLAVSLMFIACSNVSAQQAPFKIGVFDLDIMVRAMPQYGKIDTLVAEYEKDSLGAEYEIYQSEYQRLDSTWKKDSADGTKSKAIMDYTANQRQQMAVNIVYWNQIAQQKSDNKRGELAQPLYELIANAYKKVIETRKYTLILKPGSYELGSTVDNLFIPVARELKLTDLPQQLVMLGPDPDAKQQQQKPPVTPPANKKP
ncbi:MAG TPA: OmpH family outer membrane protein [Chitinophagaceae bacterium]|nr:OmpH family outer membrane protein [Chitinophagaceae bacterium]